MHRMHSTGIVFGRTPLPPLSPSDTGHSAQINAACIHRIENDDCDAHNAGVERSATCAVR